MTSQLFHYLVHLKEYRFQPRTSIGIKQLSTESMALSGVIKRVYESLSSQEITTLYSVNKSIFNPRCSSMTCGITHKLLKRPQFQQNLIQEPNDSIEKNQDLERQLFTDETKSQEINDIVRKRTARSDSF